MNDTNVWQLKHEDSDQFALGAGAASPKGPMRKYTGITQRSRLVVCSPSLDISERGTVIGI